LIAEYVPAPNTPNWRTRIIKEGDLIERATAHFIALDDQGKIVYPINGQRPRDTHETREYVEKKKIQ